jgi:hypothetical protein
METLNERIEKIIRDRIYDELLPEEKFILDYNGIDRLLFEQLKSLDERLIHEYWKEFENMEPDKASFMYLKNKLKEKSNLPPVWGPKLFWIFNYRIPAYLSFILMILLATTGWFIGKNTQQATGYVLPKEVIYKTDTLYLASVPDTVTVEKVVYMNNKEGGLPVAKKYRIDKTYTDLDNFSGISQLTSKVGLSYNENETIPELLVSDK